jgi:hypothetical protein
MEPQYSTDPKRPGGMMSTAKSKMLTLITALAIACASMARAEDQPLQPGVALFADHCAVCHGDDAKGGGEAAELTIGKVPDLTKIAQRRGGVFPFLEIFAIIRGYAGDGPHERRTMPFTGKVFAYDADRDPSSVKARARQLELTYYLSVIQE